MKKKWPFLLVGIVFLTGIVGSFLLLQHPDTDWVEIIQNGNVLYRLNLTQTEDQIIEVKYEDRLNRIEIQDHKIHMLEADCPDHTCINMGWLNSAAPIVCLPNHLVIQFSDSEKTLDVTVN